ncbi:MAG: TonB-dependent receptor [Saprospiraceae bacterium]|nr:TonB-dependent receptor [Saprospiraceae bacterium]
MKNFTLVLVFLASQWANCLIAQAHASVRYASNIELQSPQTTYHIGFSQASIADVFAKIERAVGIRFIYNETKIGQTTNVNIAENNYTLDRLLTIIELQTGLQFKQISNMIAVSRPAKTTPSVPALFSSIMPKTVTVPPVSGKVTDKNGEAIVGASVRVKGTTKGGLTDLDGKFSFDAEKGDILVVSFVGFKTLEIAVGDNTTFDIKLEDSDSVISEVTVIGSRGKPRTDVNRAVPVDVITAKELQVTGQTELGQMAQFTAPSFNSAKYGINGVANYADPATLRGMSPDQVLLLVNGKRRHQFSALNLNVTLGKGTVTTDMNSIPSLAVDRLEILRDGAAAQYGSDAIAGIVNLGLNKSVGKGTFRTQVGQHNTTVVTTLGERNVTDGQQYMASLNYGFKLGKEGSFLNATLSYNHANGTQRSDPYQGRIYVAAGATPATTLIREDSIRAARGIYPTSTSKKDFTVSTYGSNPLTAIQTFVNIGYPLSKDWSLYAFGGTSQKQVAAEGFFRNAIPTDANSNIAKYPDGYDPDLPGVSKDASGVIGVSRKLDKGWNMDFSTGFGRNTLDLRAENTTNPSMGEASPTAFYVGKSAFGQSTTEANLSKSMDIKGVKSFNFAVGGQYRIDFFKLTKGDENSYKEGPIVGKASGSSGRPGIAPADEIDANRSNIGLYADVETDITDKFLVTSALRFENYNDFGNNISGKLATRLKVTEGIALRASINKGFRAPSLQQIFNSTTTSTVQAGAIRQTKQLPSNDKRLESLGIGSPKAENSWNYNLGLTAKAGEKLLFTLDAYRIDITDRIIISEALRTTAVPAVKALFAGTSIQEISFFTNHLSTKTQGIDFVTTFKHAFTEDSRFTASLALTANKTEITGEKETPSQLTAGAANPKTILIIDTISRSLIETSQPRQKAILSLGYQYKKFNVTVRANHFGEVIAWEKSGIHRSQTFGARTIFDAVLTYTATKNISVSLGSNNLTDVYPDKVLSNYASYFAGQTPYTRNANQFGFNGRFTYLNATINF